MNTRRCTRERDTVLLMNRAFGCSNTARISGDKAGAGCRAIRFAHDAEAGVELRVQRRGIGGEDVIAHAQEREVVATSQSMNWIASAVSSAGSGGGLLFNSAITSPTRASIGRQSVTASRTSESDCSRSSMTAVRRASSSTRST